MLATLLRSAALMSIAGSAPNAGFRPGPGVKISLWLSFAEFCASVDGGLVVTEDCLAFTVLAVRSADDNRPKANEV